MQNDLIIEIDGFKIRQNSIYKVVNKPDANAPSGLKAIGTTKIPSLGVQDTAGCRFDTRTGKWDHGFNSNCPCYSGKSSEEIQRTIDVLNDRIATPYQNQFTKGDEIISTNSAENFWTDYSFTIEDGKVFKTNDTKDLFDLYMAIRSYTLTPDNQKGSPKYSNSDYVVIDKNLAVEHKKSQNTNKIDAITEFGILLKTDKTKLLHILYYMGSSFSDDASDVDLKSIFATITENSENVDYFMSIIKEAENKEGEERLYIYKKLKNSFNRDGGVRKEVNGSFTYKDVEIGADLKSAATKISNHKDFKSIKKELLLESED